MGDGRTPEQENGGGGVTIRLSRTRPRAFIEWQTLRRWGRLPVWERDVPGYLLRLARTEAGLSQRELAQRLGITQQAVSRAERWNSNPTVAVMRRWLKVCGRSLRLELSGFPERGANRVYS